MEPLAFLGDLSPSSEGDLSNWDKKNVRPEPGVYILLSGDGTTFRYPRGESPVFYIGQAKKLRGRLNGHVKAIRRAKDREKDLYRPLQEYGAAFGAKYLLIIPASTDIKPKALEVKVMARFAKMYRSLPVANSAGAWKEMRTCLS